MRILLPVVLLLTVHGVGAQPLDVGLGGTTSMGAAYDGFWTADRGVMVHLAAPVYGGQGHLDVHAFTNSPERAGLPDFLALRGTAGWGPRIALGPVRFTAGGTVGAVQFRFEEDERFPVELESETELTTGLFARLEVGGSWPIRAFTTAEWTRVYTAEPISYRFFTGGLAVRLEMPNWMRRLVGAP